VLLRAPLDTPERPCILRRSRESDEGDAGVQSIGSGVVEVTPGDYFELIARQTSGTTKTVGADELTCSALEVVE
jgi:NAD-dependent dihydropyrimidine dehydrogenase PreA subunit